MGVFNLLWVALTSMIGSGWLFGSLYSAHYAGPAALLAWPIAGVLLLFVALAYAEIATCYPQDEGLTQLPTLTHGRLTSIAFAGFTWISLATIPVIETQGLIQYASNYIPHLVVRHQSHYVCTPFGNLIALIILFSFVMLNYYGVKLFLRINSIFTIWKLLIPTITIVFLSWQGMHLNNLVDYGGFMPYGVHGIATAMSSGGVLFSLLGFRQVVMMMGAVRNPQKHIPLVLILSLALTTLLYTALQYVFLISLRPQDLALGWQHLSFPGDAGPFAALAMLAGLIWLSMLLYVDAVVSPYSTGLVYSTTAARMLAHMSSAGDIPARFARKNKYDVPWFSLLIDFGIAMFMFRFLHNWQAMAAFLVAVMMMSYSMGPINLICLRKQYPDMQRPLKLPCAYLIAYIGFSVCTIGIYWSGLASVMRLLIISIFATIIYLSYLTVQKQSLSQLQPKGAIWLLCYLIGLVIFSYLGQYGGRHLIPLNYDLMLLLVFAFIIFNLAIYCRRWGQFKQEQ